MKKSRANIMIENLENKVCNTETKHHLNTTSLYNQYFRRLFEYLNPQYANNFKQRHYKRKTRKSESKQHKWGIKASHKRPKGNFTLILISPVCFRRKSVHREQAALCEQVAKYLPTEYGICLPIKGGRGVSGGWVGHFDFGG